MVYIWNIYKLTRREACRPTTSTHSFQPRHRPKMKWATSSSNSTRLSLGPARMAPQHAVAPASPHRAVITLVARGEGSYVSPSHERRPIIPDYVATALPLLCSFSMMHTGSSLPLVVLTANLTTDEEHRLRAYGVQTMDALAMMRVAAPRALDIHGPPSGAKKQGCLLQSKGGWMAWGRSDFVQTMLKFALWLLPFDEVLYIDADAILLRPLHSLFGSLVRPGARKMSYWFDMQHDCGHLFQSGASRRPICPRLDFVGPTSSRAQAARMFDKSRVECQRPGWQSGLFLTRPSMETFTRLMRRAQAGNYTSFTRTEQDVPDAELEPSPALVACTAIALPPPHRSPPCMLTWPICMHW